MTKRLLALKTDLKQTASKIREQKNERCHANSGYVYGLSKNQRDYRIKHIIYCLVRGTTMEQIEGKTKEENKLSDWELSLIATGIELYSKPDEEVL